MDSGLRINLLPAGVIAQIKSSITVTSLNTVVIELLKNSLDANAKKIEVTVDYVRGNCVVEDDGVGILPVDFTDSGGLGKLHHSSKSNGATATYGNCGAFLASVAALSLMSITSHHHLHHSHNTLIINRSQVIARLIPAPANYRMHTQKHGTRVSVRDLFGNIPVRVKQRAGESSKSAAAGRDWEELRKLATSLMLACPSPVLLVVRNVVSGQKLHFREVKSFLTSGNDQSDAKLVTQVCNTLSQAMFVSSPDPSQWISTRASTPGLRIRGVISLEAAPTKAAQFLSLGMEPLNVQYGHSIICEEINRLFESSSFGNEECSSDYDNAKTKDVDCRSKADNFTIKELKGSKKGPDRWPMFFMRIEFLDSVGQGVERTNADDIMEGKNGSLNSIVKLLKIMVLEFLTTYKFKLRINRPMPISQKKESAYTRYLTSEDSSAGQVKRRTQQSLGQVQSRNVGSPFDMWSRVKSGSPRLTSQIPKQLLKPTVQAFGTGRELAVSSAATRIPVYSSSLNSDLEKASTKSNTLMIAQSGKVVCLPFDGLSPLAPETMPDSQPVQNVESISVINSYNGKDDYLQWLNPVTKIDSLINSRTGLVDNLSKTERLMPHTSSHLPPEVNNYLLNRDIVPVRGNDKSPARSSAWIDKVVRNWNNPIYRPVEISIPGVSNGCIQNGSHCCSQFDIAGTPRDTATYLNSRISKEALQQSDVICQVDNKFILIKISALAASFHAENMHAGMDMLVVVDQHAADERCRIEALLEEFCNEPVLCDRSTVETSSKSGIQSALLEKPMILVMPRCDAQLLQMHIQHFAHWGIIYEIQHWTTEVHQRQEYKVIVRSLPPSIMERCTTTPKLLVELLRSEVWRYSEKIPSTDTVEIEPESIDAYLKYPWLRKLHSCPQALLEMLNSRACRSSIMFNDTLSKQQCKALIARLADCAFPFQCAHGRPSMIPLASLDSFPSSMFDEKANRRHEASFGAALKKWRSGTLGITMPL